MESATAEQAALPDDSVLELVRDAIARRRCITAIYNRVVVTLAPHALYTRHDEPFIDAVTVDRDGQKPREVKIGVFKLAGLGDIAPTNRLFSAHRLFEPRAEKYAGVMLASVAKLA